MRNKPFISKMISLIVVFACFLFLYIYGESHNWALTLILFLIPLVCGIIVSFFSEKRYHELFKKSAESLLALFSIISFGYYIFSISHKNPTLSFSDIFSSLLGYLFLTIISLSGVIKLCIGLKELLNEYFALREPTIQAPIDCEIIKQNESTNICIKSTNNNDIYVLIEKEKK
ncbi:hypothetical protein [Pectobacterium aroidearum]|uniref:hypothetical protein n=1 Tax=Pectobacterium aroidearum TaxID=1201031 RepID=UPI0032EDA94C